MRDAEPETAGIACMSRVRIVSLAACDCRTCRHAYILGGMNPNRLLIGILYIAYTMTRIRSERASGKRGPGMDGAEARKEGKALGTLTVLEIVILALYYLRFPPLRSLDIPLTSAGAAFAFWSGAFFGIFGLALVAAAMATLDGEYSPVVELKADHRLVTTGPYRFLRHPIYAGLFLFNIGVALLAANAVIAFVWIPGFAGIVGMRLRHEESVLQRRFGPRWQDYRRKTGAFFPILHRQARRAPGVDGTAADGTGDGSGD